MIPAGEELGVVHPWGTAARAGADFEITRVHTFCEKSQKGTVCKLSALRRKRHKIVSTEEIYKGTYVYKLVRLGRSRMLFLKGSKMHTNHQNA